MLVSYETPENHHAKTLRGDVTLHGSIHHPEMTAFTGLVTRVNDDGSYDLLIFPPARSPVHVAGVPYGTGPGTCTEAPSLVKPTKS